MRTFHLQIVTPDGLVFDSEAESIIVRGEDGYVEIMRGHTDFFAPLATGSVKLTVGGKSSYAAASGGFISVKNGEVMLVTTTFEYADQIDEKRANEAKLRAENSLKTETDKNAILIAKAKLARALNRISVAQKGTK